jgi:hypothetical protein
MRPAVKPAAQLQPSLESAAKLQDLALASALCRMSIDPTTNGWEFGRRSALTMQSGCCRRVVAGPEA